MGIIYSIQKRKKKGPQKCIHQAQQPILENETSEDNNHVTQSGVTRAVGASPGLDAKGRCQICREQQLTARRYRIRLVIGLFFPFALSALDVTIVASALPWIATDFNELSQMNWIISAFNLCSATFIPLWGQFFDIYGRTATLEACLVVMMIGSALCTAAPLTAFPLFIFGRALQGLSVAGITVGCKVILADKVSLKDNAKNTSIFAMFGGLSYAIGPVIGGFLTDKTWRWCFGINLPVAAIGAILVFLVLKPQLLGPQPLSDMAIEETGNAHIQRFKARMATIDYGGQFLFLFGMGLLILALTWGGAKHSWSSAAVVTPLVLGCIFLISFVGWQYFMAPNRYLSRKFPLQKPTFPWALITNRNMYILFYINFATGMALTAVLYFVDIYFTLVKAYTPSQAGIQLLYYTPGIGGGVYLAMIMCNFYPRQTFFPLFLGSIIEATGISVLCYALKHGHVPTIYGMMALTGAGTGLRFMPGSLHGIGFFPNNISSVISMMSFAIPFGGTMAMTIMGTVFNNKGSIAAKFNTPATHSTSGTDGIYKLDPKIQKIISDSAKDGVVWAFIAILPFMWLCVMAASCLGNVKITGKGVSEKGGADFRENVEDGVFLWVVLRKRLGKKKKDGVVGEAAPKQGVEGKTEKHSEVGVIEASEAV